jgi:hypothetical protein
MFVNVNDAVPNVESTTLLIVVAFVTAPKSPNNTSVPDGDAAVDQFAVSDQFVVALTFVTPIHTVCADAWTNPISTIINTPATAGLHALLTLDLHKSDRSSRAGIMGSIF